MRSIINGSKEGKWLQHKSQHESETNENEKGEGEEVLYAKSQQA